ncbi:hypothetical protein PGT21_014972 [Puccinia graminis f. sp. tritici]|uniref:Uncharacterized protein n=1 Tax=Puccinia graminis f. sp. tritici TaxID=56615 RepID=A0A5B0M140_PUCGR|nr:hypothetical protein PGTUg99_007843 [Puccinia graminis f. sp. tritici]KAA1101268.1 hypothetical protein PGT21_014972 [Puccinia graminis f. sp. tritici]
MNLNPLFLTTVMGLNASRHTRHTTQPNIYLATLLSQSVHPHPRSTLPTQSNQSISPSQAPIGFYLVVWLLAVCFTGFGRSSHHVA